jgi:HK97 family phage prohead protease
MQQRAYSLLTIKSVNEDAREITEVATTPSTDSYGDIVDPEGAEYKLPIPLLWQHNASQPIGEVYAARTTKDGIEIKARLVKIDEPGTLADRLNEAWQSIKSGLVKGLSIGFRALEYSIMNDTGGYKFSKWQWLELSSVTIPANADCSITTIRSQDAKIRAALGNKPDKVPANTPSGASEKKKVKPVKLSMAKEAKNMKIAEQIKEYENESATKAAQMEQLMEKSADAGATLDEAQSEEFAALEKEIAEIDKHLKRLNVLQKAQMKQRKRLKPMMPKARRKPVAAKR